MRLLLVLGAAVAVGVAAGSAIAPLPYTANDECSVAPGAYEPTGGEGELPVASLEVWPLRMRCDYNVGTSVARSLLIGPSVAETVAWSALVALLVGAALWKRRSALLRGAVIAACFMAPVVAGLLYSEFIFACWVAVWIGVPIAVGLEFAMLPRGERRWWRSVFVGCALSAIVFFACFFWTFAGLGRIGIAAGIVVGALAAVLLPRVWSYVTSPVVQPI